MKKILAFLFLLIPAVLFADSVSKETAAKAAVNFFGAKQLITKSSSNAVLKWESESYYLFSNNNEDYVIISADDVMQPVLAYFKAPASFTRENVPDNLDWWFNAMDEQVRYRISHGHKADTKTKEMWSDILYPTKGSVVAAQDVVYYETARWDQGSPYNKECPVLDGKSPVTGCVATAGAIFMRFHEWPNAGKGSLPEYTYYNENEHKSYTIEGKDLGNIYNWNKMPLGKPSSDEEKYEVARLIADVGIMSKCMYGHSSTGAYTDDLYYGLITYMGYDERGQYLGRYMYNREEWIGMLEETLMADGPVLYSGSGNDGGHQFVFCGYDTNDLFYVNWGWSGSGDGYFDFEDLEPNPGMDFNKYQDAMFGMKPGVFIEKGALTMTTDLTPNYKVYDLDHDFYVTLHLNNKSESNYSGKVKLSLYDSKGEFKKDISEEVYLDGYDNEKLKEVAILCNIGKYEYEVEAGDCIKASCRNAGQQEWEIIPAGSNVNLLKIEELGSVDSFTSVDYDNILGVLTIKTHSDVKWSLKDSNGKDNSSKFSFENGIITIEKSKLPAGKYSLNLTKGKSSKTITFIVGE